MISKIAFQPLPQLPSGSNVFIDSNIFVYALSGTSAQCRQLLERCSREEVTGITLFEIVNEATHKFMLAEAQSKGFISRESASSLKKKFKTIATLGDYWNHTERVLALNLLFLSTEETIVRAAHLERSRYCLLTNDSMIVSCMRNFGVSCLATRDKDFARVSGISVYRPEDLPDTPS